MSTFLICYSQDIARRVRHAQHNNGHVYLIVKNHQNIPIGGTAALLKYI